MRVCQFRHFGTRHESGTSRQTGSIFESRKCRPQCQILNPPGFPRARSPALIFVSGVKRLSLNLSNLDFESQGFRKHCTYFRFSASSSSSVRGQSDPSSRDRLRSANTFPPVWHFAQ